jgi:S1-C subfamily serine protease
MMRHFRRPFVIALFAPFSLALCGQPPQPTTLRPKPDCNADGEPVRAADVAAAELSLVMVRAYILWPVGNGTEEREVYGFGTVIDDRGRVLTALHILRNARSVGVMTVSISDGAPKPSGNRAEMRLVSSSPELDAAVIEPTSGTLDLPPLPVELSPPETDQQVLVLQGTAGWQSGFIRETNATQPPRSGLIEINVATSRGDSGSPLVNRCGRLVGFLILGNPANPHSYYVPAKTALLSLGIHPAP